MEQEGQPSTIVAGNRFFRFKHRMLGVVAVTKEKALVYFSSLALAHFSQ